MDHYCFALLFLLCFVIPVVDYKGISTPGDTNINRRPGSGAYDIGGRSVCRFSAVVGGFVGSVLALVFGRLEGDGSGIGVEAFLRREDIVGDYQVVNVWA